MLIRRVLAGLPDVRASYTRELALHPPESRLLAYAMLGCGLIFLGRLPDLMRTTPAGAAAEAYVGALLVAHVLFGPLMLYALAGLTRIVAGRFGGSGSWQKARLALFWAVLITAPLVLVSGALANLAGQGLASMLASGLASLVMLRVWAICLGAAEGLASWPVTGLLLLVPLATAGLLWLAGRG